MPIASGFSEVRAESADEAIPDNALEEAVIGPAIPVADIRTSLKIPIKLVNIEPILPPAFINSVMALCPALMPVNI